MSTPKHTAVDAHGKLWTIPATAVRAVSVFNADGPTGYQAVEPWVIDAPIRATRDEARRDIEAAL